MNYRSVWIEHEWTHEEWRRAELAFMPQYWETQTMIEGLSPILGTVITMLSEWNGFKDRRIEPSM